MKKIVVIGAGQAGVALCAKLRASGFDGTLDLIGKETAPPYQRPPLSKGYLLGDMATDRLSLRAPSFYKDNDINLHLGKAVQGIDANSKKVDLGNRTLSYDALALTTGATARPLPAQIGGDLVGVYTVRNLHDVDMMRAEFVAGASVVIIGGGYIGLEAAAVAKKLGLDVTVIEMAPRILQRVAAKQTSDYFRALHQSHGVKIIEGVGIDRLSGEIRVASALLTDGRTLRADFVIAGVGIYPNVELAANRGLHIDNGIATDILGQCSDAHIWSAGDCASFIYQGQRIRIESVQNAIDQAENAAANMLGAAQPYEPLPWFWSDQFDCKLQIAGLNNGYDAVVARGHSGGAQSFWYFKGEALLAVDAMNDPRAFMVAKRILAGSIGVDKAIVADETFDLKKLLK
ncbi:MAG: FAD-dependent oxidoreductase [Paracoccaceae bacterium]|jgi:3-phenylpropionate/trans-cinnamate dioxygenase ferredoxin reductase subunit